MVTYVLMISGRCRPCHRRYAWPKSAATLSTMTCPRCGRPLSRTSSVAADRAVELSANEARALAARGREAELPVQ